MTKPNPKDEHDRLLALCCWQVMREESFDETFDHLAFKLCRISSGTANAAKLAQGCFDQHILVFKDYKESSMDEFAYRWRIQLEIGA